MPWYRAGSVAVTNGSAIVTGAGTDFVGNTQAGEVFLGPDGRVYEISAIQSATQLTIIPNYQGASAGGQAYGIQPTASFARDLAILAAQLLNTFGAVRDGIGQGLIADGTTALPAIRFSADQDTGIRRAGENGIALVAGGVDRCWIAADRAAEFFNGLRASSAAPLGVGVPPGTISYEHPVTRHYVGDGTGYSTTFSKRSNGVTSDLMRIDDQGIVTIGSGLAYGTTAIIKDVPVNGPLLLIGAPANYSLLVQAVGQTGWAFANAALFVGKADTGRSINAGGTINANGADYAEYMFKADGCGIIAKGDVCGVDRDGKLTKTWGEAISFVVKSTDPSLVGGDIWSAHLPTKPRPPAAEPKAPVLPDPPINEADEGAIAAWRAIQAAYPALLAAHQAEHATWRETADAYPAELTAWEGDLEAARQRVDRIAFSGQVPCNVTGAFDVGDYIIAAAAGAGIKAIAVKPDEITLPQYMRRIGKVWAVRDGRAWIDVQHG